MPDLGHFHIIIKKKRKNHTTVKFNEVLVCYLDKQWVENVTSNLQPNPC